MNSLRNRVLLIGHLGAQPETKTFTSGTNMARFSIATTETYKNDKGEKVSETQWHNIVAWRKLAEICGQYLKKGSKVYLEGKLQTRSWDDKNTGVKRYSTEIIADDLIMLDAKGNGTAVAEAPAMAEESQAPEKDDLPF